MRHSSEMRSFKQIQADMSRSYGASDLVSSAGIKKVGRYGTYGDDGKPTKYYHISQYAHEAAMLRRLQEAATQAWARGDTTLYRKYKAEFDSLKEHSFAHDKTNDPEILRAKQLKDGIVWQNPTTETYSTPEDNPTNLTPLELNSAYVHKVVDDHRFGRDFATDTILPMTAAMTGKDPTEKLERARAANNLEDMLTAYVLMHNPDKYKPEAVRSGREKMKQIDNTVGDTVYPVASKEYRKEMYPKRVRAEKEAKNGQTNDDMSVGTYKIVESASFRDMMKAKPNLRTRFVGKP